MKRVITLLIISITFFSCNNQPKKVDYSKKSSKEIVKNKETTHPGKELLETKCFVCHNATTPHNERVAPPMIAIKAHYINKNTLLEDFTKEFVSFVLKPSKDAAKMRGAIRRFGLMPYQKFKEDDIKKIADYIYNYQIEEPSWFKEHWEEKQKGVYINTGKKTNTLSSDNTSEQRGLTFALETKKTLGKNLIGTIQKEGTLEALKFCNLKAYDLTDSMATKFNATIKRVSDKPRNLNNTASVEEIAIINNYKKNLINNEEIKPVTYSKENHTQFYYPIVTNSMCLQCHGTPKTEIKQEVLSELAKLYPHDKAVNYSTNQVRGIWSITLKN